MTDFHSHILPCVDDGSQSVDESIKLLQMLSEQGITRVYATPHFYPSKDDPASFLEKRETAYQRLTEAIKDIDHPEILLGAEVAYYPGISKLKDIHKLRLQESKLLLLEMSVAEWSEYTLRELTEISCMGDLVVLIAHAERYRKYQKEASWCRLIDMGLWVQSNASYFISPKTRRKALKQLKNNEIHLIGSDCHNVSERKPKIGEAFQIIKDKLGIESLDKMERLSQRLNIN